MNARTGEFSAGISALSRAQDLETAVNAVNKIIGAFSSNKEAANFLAVVDG